MVVVVPKEDEKFGGTSTVAACCSDSINDKTQPAHVSPVEDIDASHRLPFKKRMIGLSRRPASTEDHRTDSIPLPGIDDFFDESDLMTAALALKPPKLVRQDAKYYAETQSHKKALANECKRKRAAFLPYEPIPFVDTRLSFGSGCSSDSDRQRRHVPLTSGTIDHSKSSTLPKSSSPTDQIGPHSTLYPSSDHVEDCPSPTKKYRHQDFSMLSYLQNLTSPAFDDEMPDLESVVSPNDDSFRSISPQSATTPASSVESRGHKKLIAGAPFVLERCNPVIPRVGMDFDDAKLGLAVTKHTSKTHTKQRRSSDPLSRPAKEQAFPWKPLTRNGIRFGKWDKDLECRIRLHQYLLFVNKDKPSLEDLINHGLLSPTPKRSSLKKAPPTRSISSSTGTGDSGRGQVAKAFLKPPPPSSCGPPPAPVCAYGETDLQANHFHYSDSALLSSYSFQEDIHGYKPRRNSGGEPYPFSTQYYPESRPGFASYDHRRGSPGQSKSPGYFPTGVCGQTLPFSPIVTPEVQHRTTWSAALRAYLPEPPFCDSQEDSSESPRSSGWV